MDIALPFFEALFCLSIFCIFWLFIGYRLSLMAVSKFVRKKCSCNDRYTAAVSVIVPAHNEEKVISEKLRNVLDLNYPKDMLDIVVVDDGSTDGTSKLAEDYMGWGVKIIRQESRQGKPSAINLGLKYASGDVILITDANSFFEKNAVMKLVRNFSDLTVGGVGGRYEPHTEMQGIGLGDQVYWKNENFSKERESVIDSIVGMNGNIAAVRGDILRAAKLEADSVTEDFELTVCIRKMGYRVIYEPEAYSWKLAPGNVKEGIVQKRRRSIGTIQTLMRHKDALFNPKYGFYGGLILPSHKLLPMLLPFFIMVALLSLVALCMFANTVVYRYLLYVALFVLAYSCVSALILLRRSDVRQRLLILPGYFMIVQLSVMLAWMDYLRGRRDVTWRKAETTREIAKVT